jgi:hypothetical protein
VRLRDHHWLLLILILWIVGDTFLVLAASAPRPAAIVIPAGSVPGESRGTERSLPSGNPSQPTEAPRASIQPAAASSRPPATLLADFLIEHGGQVTYFPDGREIVLTGRDVIVSLWVADPPTAATPDSLNVQWVLR